MILTPTEWLLAALIVLCLLVVAFAPAHAAAFGCKDGPPCICSVQPKGIHGYGPNSAPDEIDLVCTNMRTMEVTYFTATKSQAPFSAK